MSSVSQLVRAALILVGATMLSSSSFAASGAPAGSLTPTQARDLIDGFSVRVDKEKGQVLLSGRIARECVSELQVIHDPPGINNQLVFTIVDPNGRGISCLTRTKGTCARNSASCSEFAQLAQEASTLAQYRSIAVVEPAVASAVKTSLRTYGVSSRPLPNGDLPPPDAFDQLEAMAMIDCACGVPNPPGVDSVASQVTTLRDIVSAAGSTETLTGEDGHDHAEFIDTGETVGEAFGGEPVFAEMPVPVDQVAAEVEDPRERARRRLAERREIEESATKKARAQATKAQLIQGGFALATQLLPMMASRKVSSYSNASAAAYQSPYYVQSSPNQILGGYNFFNYPVNFGASSLPSSTASGYSPSTGNMTPIGGTGPMGNVGGWWQNGSAPQSR